ncbi:DUF3300 domain-containing protein [Colwellia asteriadis]|uniref:DUF3300 domain-containing protein n=1 Tax=Colwellia asteriadis TaxID=517723 RepID=A0ABN1L854_9GAMM
MNRTQEAIMNDRLKNHINNSRAMWLLILLLSTINLAWSSVAYANNNTISVQDSQGYSEAELAQMLAPIALYPDSLLTHMLIAATYPLEVVQAQRWLIKQTEQLGSYSATEILDNAEDQDWDPSVKALLPFANVLERLNSDLNWTEQLGDAFLFDEEAVLQSIQTLRKQAQVAGHLANMENMQVSYDNSAIIIEPNKPEIIYVPYYDPRVVYGHWRWGHYPPVYWNAPHYSSTYYHNRYQPFYWHTGVHVTAQLFFGAVHWQNRHVVIIKPSRRYHHKSHYYNRTKIIASHSAKRWQHKPHHRRGGSYKYKGVNKPFTKKVNQQRRYKNRNTAGIKYRNNDYKSQSVRGSHNRLKTKKDSKARHASSNKNSRAKRESNYAYKQSQPRANRKLNIAKKHVEQKRSAPRNKIRANKAHETNIKHNQSLAKHTSTKSARRSNYRQTKSQQPKKTRQARVSHQSKANKSRQVRAERSHH